MALNINGRICLYFTVIWGFLGIFLIKFINPLINKFLNKFNSSKKLKYLILFTMEFIILDASVSGIALKSFYSEIVNDFNLKEKTSILINTPIFSAKNMIKTYPNIQIAGTKYNNTLVSELYKEKIK